MQTAKFCCVLKVGERDVRGLIKLVLNREARNSCPTCFECATFQALVEWGRAHSKLVFLLTLCALLNAGQCVDGRASFTCVCDEGFTGRRCEVEMDPCTTFRCKNDAFCCSRFRSVRSDPLAHARTRLSACRLASHVRERSHAFALLRVCVLAFVCALASARVQLEWCL